MTQRRDTWFVLVVWLIYLSIHCLQFVFVCPVRLLSNVLPLQSILIKHTFCNNNILFLYIFVVLGSYKMYLYYHISYTVLTHVLELLDFIEIYLYKVNQLFSFTYTYTHVQWYQYANHSLFFSVFILSFFPFLSFFLSISFFLSTFFSFPWLLLYRRKYTVQYILHMLL